VKNTDDEEAKPSAGSNEKKPEEISTPPVGSDQKTPPENSTPPVEGSAPKE